jgi:hypothetical protein
LQLLELRDAFQSREFSEASDFFVSRLSELLKDPAFRYQVARPARTEDFLGVIRPINLIGNYYEDMDALVMAGLIDPDLTCTIYGDDIVPTWDRLQPVTAILRREGGSAIWENFEYVAMVAKQRHKENPEGAYPRGAQRLQIEDVWLDADKQYAASLAPA